MYNDMGETHDHWDAGNMFDAARHSVWRVLADTRLARRAMFGTGLIWAIAGIMAIVGCVQLFNARFLTGLLLVVLAWRGAPRAWRAHLDQLVADVRLPAV